MVLGNFQCRGVLLIWIIVGQGPVALACNRYRIDGLWPFFCMCHPSFLIYIQIISFSFVHQSPVRYLFPIHSKYLIFFCLSISCPLPLSITFKLSHFLLFIDLMSIISFHYIKIISFSFVHQSHVYCLWYTIPFKSSHYDCLWNIHSILISFSFVHQISCPPIPFKFSFSFVYQFHAHYLFPLKLSYFLFINSWYTYTIQINSSDSLWNTHSILNSFSFVYQSHAHYFWYTYSIQIIPLSCIHQSHAHYLWYL